MIISLLLFKHLVTVRRRTHRRRCPESALGFVIEMSNGTGSDRHNQQIWTRTFPDGVGRGKTHGALCEIWHIRRKAAPVFSDGSVCRMSQAYCISPKRAPAFGRSFFHGQTGMLIKRNTKSLSANITSWSAPTPAQFLPPARFRDRGASLLPHREIAPRRSRLIMKLH